MFNNRNQFARLFLMLAVLCGGAFFASTNSFAQAKPKASGPIQILFVGNSYTSANNLPLMFTRLAESGKKPKVQIKTSLRRGWTLNKHWTEEKPATTKTIEDGKFHYVVIQEQSQMPFLYGHVTHEFGVKLGELAKSKGATPVYYMTWARLHQPENQSKIAATYRKMGKSTKSPVAPVGQAWEIILKQKEPISLHRSDRSHPTPAGTYLAACVFYSTIYKQTPVGLSRKLFTQPGNKGKVVVQLTAGQAKRLQEAAWKAVQAEAK